MNLMVMTLMILSTPVTGRAQESVHQPTPDVSPPPSNWSGSSVELLTPSEGVDFKSYVGKLTGTVKKNWYAAMPAIALSGEKGKTTIQFHVQRDGKVEDISLEGCSGKESLDRAALSAIRDSSPFDPLPSPYKGPFIILRFTFTYNMALEATPPSSPLGCNAPTIGAPHGPPFDRLELLSLVVGSFCSPYDVQEINGRGISFVPDSVFLKAVQDLQRGQNISEAIQTTKHQVTTSDPPQRQAAYNVLLTAVEDMRKHSYASADEEFQHALALTPDSAMLQLAYAADLLALKKYVPAEEQCRRSLQLFPENAEAYTLLAISLVGQNRDKEAIPEARKALEIFPSNKSATVALAMSLARSRQYSEAIPVLRQAIPHIPEMPLLRKHLGVSLFETGDFDGAIEQLSIYLNGNPDDAEAHYFLGAAFRAKRKPDEALAEFREAARLEPNNPVYSSLVDPGDSNAAAATEPKPAGPRPDDCFFSGDVYTNTFFGFSYQYPKGWVVLSADAGRALTRMGGALLANGDATLGDVAEAGVRNAYQLLAATQQSTKEISPSVGMIQIQAFDKRIGPGIKSAQDFSTSMVGFLQQRGLAMSVVEPPEQISISGRDFWKTKLDVRARNVLAHELQIVTMEKGYLIVFTLASPDLAKFNELVGTIQSIRFTESSH